MGIIGNKDIFLLEYFFLSRKGFSINLQEKNAKIKEQTTSNIINRCDGSFNILILANANSGWCQRYAE